MSSRDPATHPLHRRSRPVLWIAAAAACLLLLLVATSRKKSMPPEAPATPTRRVPPPAPARSEPPPDSPAKAPAPAPPAAPEEMGNAEEPVHWTPDIEMPTLLHRVQAEYPEEARRAGMQGTVFLEAIINGRGDVEDVTVIRSPDPLFDREATAAVRQWKYTPALQNGRPVKMFITVIVEFKLTRDGSDGSSRQGHAEAKPETGAPQRRTPAPNRAPGAMSGRTAARTPHPRGSDSIATLPARRVPRSTGTAGTGTRLTASEARTPKQGIQEARHHE